MHWNISGEARYPQSANITHVIGTCRCDLVISLRYSQIDSIIKSINHIGMYVYFGQICRQGDERENT